jgi:hypothetical protein
LTKLEKYSYFLRHAELNKCIWCFVKECHFLTKNTVLGIVCWKELPTYTMNYFLFEFTMNQGCNSYSYNYGCIERKCTWDSVQNGFSRIC